MLRIFKTLDGKLSTLDTIEEDSWICLTDPTLEEIMEVASVCKIDADDLRASLDEEEASRIEITDDYTLIKNKSLIKKHFMRILGRTAVT